MESATEFVHFQGFKGTTRIPIAPTEKIQSRTLNVPIVDCKAIYSTSLEDRKTAARSIKNALHDHGVLYVSGHGIPEESQKKMEEQGSIFFKKPLEEKMKYHQSNSMSGKRGYQYLSEGRDDEPGRHDYREGFKAMMNSTGHSQHEDNPWPQEQATFRRSFEGYEAYIRRFVDHFLRAVALAMGADEDFFAGVAGQVQGLCLLYYPPAAESKNDGRAVHTDYSIITIIDQLSPVPVLEVCDRKTGHFFLVPPVPGTLIVNVGDFLERMSNNSFQSTVHRVRNHPEQERYSLVYFFDADPEATIEVASSCIDEKKPKLYETVKAGDWQRGLYLR